MFTYKFLSLSFDFITRLITEAAPSSNVVISRTGWTPAGPSARSLTKPNRSYYSIQNNKLHRINEALRRRNYASSSESNADLVPFLYKDNLQSQPILFNSNYQLSGSNSGQVYAQNIAYIQPNSVSPFQPNFLLVPAGQPAVQQLANVSAPVSANSTAVQQSPAGQSAAGQSTAGQPSVASAPVISSNPIEQPASRPVSESIVTANASDSIAQFDVSQVGENPDEIAPEHVQNHENLDAVPVNSVEDSAKVNLTYSDPSSVDVASISNLSSISNATTSQISSQPTNPLGEENRQPEPIQNARLIEIPAYVYGSNFVRRLESGPVYEPVRVRSPKNLVTSRAHRSLYRSPPIDMPSMVGLYTAAAAQSGHTRENRRDLFARFLDENS